MDVVISRFSEDVSWTSGLKHNVILYNKGESIPQRYIQLPNVGREAHTYLHHIVFNYENLSDRTVFVQGNPFDHADKVTKEEFVEKLNDFHSDKLYEPLFTDLNNHDTLIVTNHHYRPLPVATYNRCISTELTKDLFFAKGAQWYVTKEAILSKSLNWWIHLYQLLSIEHGNGWDSYFNAWTIERLWGYFFNPNVKEKFPIDS